MTNTELPPATLAAAHSDLLKQLAVVYCRTNEIAPHDIAEIAGRLFASAKREGDPFERGVKTLQGQFWNAVAGDVARQDDCL